jgi:hypothetical protein
VDIAVNTPAINLISFSATLPMLRVNWMKLIPPLNSASYPSLAKVMRALLIYSLERI